MRGVPLPPSSRFLVGAFLASGVVHLVKPEVYEPLMPAWVPAHREVPMVRAALRAARS